MDYDKTIRELESLLCETGYFLPVNLENRFIKIGNGYLTELSNDGIKLDNPVDKHYYEYYVFDAVLFSINEGRRLDIISGIISIIKLIKKRKNGQLGK